jgi:glycosyltransferase involved in cell wall biosynthesis
MNVTLGYICLNEEDLIAANLANHYAMADKIVVVEGADRRFPNATPDGLSTDATAEIVRSFPDPDKKIIFIQHGWAADKSELRNRYCDLADTGILIAVDVDEFLSPESATALIERLKLLPGLGTVRAPHVHLYKKLDRYIIGGYWNVAHQRAYRWMNGCRHHFGEHNHPATPSGKLLFRINNDVIPHRFTAEGDHPPPYWLHLGFTKSANEIADKNKFYVNRGEAQTRPGTTRDRAAWFKDEVPSGCEVRPWIGWLPEIKNVRH